MGIGEHMDHGKESSETQKATNKKDKQYYINSKTKQSNLFYHCGPLTAINRSRERTYL